MGSPENSHELLQKHSPSTKESTPIWVEERGICNRIIQTLILLNGGNLNGYGGSDIDRICRKVMSRIPKTTKPNLPLSMECFCTFIGDCSCDRPVDLYNARGLGDILKIEIEQKKSY